jgi:hypothetical protein
MIVRNCWVSIDETINKLPVIKVNMNTLAVKEIKE